MASQKSSTGSTTKDTRPEQDTSATERDTPQARDTSVEEYEQIGEEVNESRTKKPGSQSGSSDQHNNGRGGGK